MTAQDKSLFESLADIARPVSMLDVIRMGASRIPDPLPCPFCGEDPPMASIIAGRYIVACGNEDCPAETQCSGATTKEAWSKWNTRAPVSRERVPLSDSELAGNGRGLR